MIKRIYILLGLLMGIVILFFGNILYTIKSKHMYDIALKIEKNENIKNVLEQITDTHSIAFKLYLKYRNGGRGIKVGEYYLNGKYNLEQILDILENGKGKVERLTIPEGYSISQIVETLEKTGHINKDKFYKELEIAMKDFPYPTKKESFEGYLYPNTYFLPEGYDEKTAINIMLSEFLKNFPVDKYPNKNEFYQKLIMASILEKEAKIKKEKPLMASVFYNRIKKGMTLSSDATVNFVYDYKKRKMYYKDLEVDSPYNTYKYKGLPPAPICNPTVDSVEAAYNPSETDYLFFVTKGDGGHYFSKTYREHLDFQKGNKVKQIVNTER